MKNKLRAWVTLNEIRNLSQQKAYEFVQLWGNPEDYVGKASYFKTSEVTLTEAQRLQMEHFANYEWDAISDLLEKNEIHFVTILDKQYPAIMKSIYNPPLYFFYRGDFRPEDFQRSIAIVGTRKPTAYGITVGQQITKELTKNKCVICSGLAYGIDTMAHTTAIENGGRTYAIMATGCDRIYPAKNKELGKEIIKNGAVISEFLPGSKAEKWNFPIRNRIISALSLGTFVVEGKQNSGALLTAKYALDQNRDIYALPGDITREQAEGPNYLIQLGAKPVLSSDSILEEYDFVIDSEEQTSFFPTLTENEDLIFQTLIQNRPEISFDEILIKHTMSVSELSMILFSLEMKGVLRRNPGNKFSPLL
jgi:DNA processing protein